MKLNFSKISLSEIMPEKPPAPVVPVMPTPAIPPMAQAIPAPVIPPPVLTKPSVVQSQESRRLPPAYASGSWMSAKPMMTPAAVSAPKEIEKPKPMVGF